MAHQWQYSHDKESIFLSPKITGGYLFKFLKINIPLGQDGQDVSRFTGYFK